MDGKRWWASKTVWTNLIAGGTAVATAFGLDLDINPEEQAAVVGGVLAVANIVLRFLTKGPVK